MDDQNEILEPLTSEKINLLVDNHRQFQKFLEKRVGDKNTAEDLLQQSLKKAIENPPTSENDLSILSWFYKVLRNALIDHYRKNASLQTKQEEFKDEAHLFSDSDSEDLHTTVCECMGKLLTTLKPEYAELLSRIDLGNETAEDLAKEKDLTRNNLDVKLHRARKALKHSLEKSCGTCTEHGCLKCTCSQK